MWTELRQQLQASPFLLPTDDLSCQRGIVATSIAVLDRISNSAAMREVSWQPTRLVAKADAKLAAALDSPTKPQSGPSSSPRPNVPSPVPPPRGPRPGGATVRVPIPGLIVPARVEIDF